MEDLDRTVAQYVAIKDQITTLTSRQNELKSRISEAVDELEPNENGHRIMSVGDVRLTRQRRVSKTLDVAQAELILTKKGIKGACMKMVPVIDEDAIMTAFYNGHLTEEDIDSMFPAKVSYALLVDTSER
jgi:hypothetical protein